MKRSIRGMLRDIGIQTHLICQTLEHSQELAQVSLPRRELTATRKVSSVEVSARINNEQSKSAWQLGQRSCGLAFAEATHLDCDISALAWTSNAFW